MISELLKVDREWLEQSVVVQEWLRQGREQGIEEGLQKGIQQGIEQGIEQGFGKGLILARRDDLLSVLKSRFGTVGPLLENAILRLEDPQRLRDLLARAAVATNLEDFARELLS
jgi:flagellar biosynthesis/type III secretory pathway protein FliH